jgi:light-harvesting complex I chlorophyll a/b binding protein 1
MDDKFWVKVLFGIALVEGTNIIKGWETVDNVAGLKDNYENGDLGFDPLNLKPSDPAAYKTLQEKELSNGRLAMIGVAGMVVQELITQQPIFG